MAVLAWKIARGISWVAHQSWLCHRRCLHTRTSILGPVMHMPTRLTCLLPLLWHTTPGDDGESMLLPGS